MPRNQLEPTTVDITTTHSETAFSDLSKIKPKNASHVLHFDIKGITDIFNSYATRKTITAGFFNIALVIYGLKIF